MSKHDKWEGQHRDYGLSWEITVSLWDAPRTLSEIMDHFYSYPRLLGFFGITRRVEQHHDWLMKRVEEKLDQLIELGWIIRQGNYYTLTSLGTEKASRPLADMRRTRALLYKIAQPQTASQISLGVHLGLAALKMPAAILSGSVGLLNDAIDTLLDGLSSLLVYFGLRLDKERGVNVVLVLLMIGTGSFALYEAVRRFFVPFEPEVDLFTFAATIVSALVCLALWVYQRYIGLRSGSLALITQSVDSRNHVIIAASVTAGLIGSLLKFPLLDTLVGLAVAILILKSAIELAIETVHSLSEEEVDFSRYEFRVVRGYERFRQAQLCGWMIYLVEKHGVQTRTELIARARQVFKFRDNPMLRELGLDRQHGVDEMIKRSIQELFKRGWLVGEKRLSVTSAGRESLGKRMS